jgi:L-ascorbate metabolism protein UlaG (beta-lactamase superfamily)
MPVRRLNPSEAPMRSIGVLVALTAAASLAGCDATIARIALRNVPLTFRSPDRVADRITMPIRTDAGLAVLWIGHSTVLMQIDDKFILTDPVFDEFIGGLSHRLVEPGMALENLPPLDVTLVSHRHFDHLSPASLKRIGSKTRAVLVPEGAGTDVPEGAYAVRELREGGIWESGGLRVTAVKVAHSGGRWPLDASSHPYAYTGYVIQYHGITVFFPGDTAYHPELFEDLRRRVGPVDLALLPICPIRPESRMEPSHLNPEQALRAAELLSARWMVPIHFDTFVESLDAPGECRTALRDAMTRVPLSVTSVVDLQIGEQRVLSRVREVGPDGPTASRAH